MTLGERIYKLRNDKGFSQGDLAEKLNVSRQSVSKWENNSAVPELEKLIKLADIFNITLDELVKDKENTNNEQKTDYVKIPSIQTRKIVGTILLCTAVCACLLLMATNGISGLIVGTMLSSPIIVCGIICLTVSKHTVLWCSWGIYVLIDLFLLYATGIRRAAILHTNIWTSSMNYTRLVAAWVIFIVLVFMMAITVYILQKNSTKTSKNQLIKALTFAAIVQIIVMIFPYTPINKYLIDNIISLSWLYNIVMFVISYLRIISITLALIFIARYFKK